MMNIRKLTSVFCEMGIKLRFSRVYGDGWQKIIVENNKKLRFGEGKVKDGFLYNMKFPNDNNCSTPICDDDYYYYSWCHYQEHGEVMSRFMFDNLRFKANEMHKNNKNNKLAQRKIDEENDIKQIKKIRKRSPIKGVSARNYLLYLIKAL